MMLLEKPPEGMSRSEIKVVVVVIEDDQGRVLLIRRSKDEQTRPGEWECVGGHLAGDESIHQAARREVKEEVGLEVTFQPGIALFSLRENHGYGIALHAQLVGPRLIKLRLKEHDAFLWVEPAQIKLFDSVPPDFEAMVEKVLGKGLKQGHFLMSRTAKHRDLQVIELAKDNQAVFSLRAPRWESLWKLSTLKKPDWLHLSQKQEPTPEDVLLDKHCGYGDNEIHIPVYNHIRDVLRSVGLEDEADVSNTGEEKALVDVTDTKKTYQVEASLRSAGFKTKRTSTHVILVDLGVARRHGKLLTDAKGKVFYRKAAPIPAPGNIQIPLPGPLPPTTIGPDISTQTPATITLQQSTVETPAKMLQRKLGPDARVDMDKDRDTITIKTTKPQEVMQETNQLIQQQHLPFKMAKKASVLLHRKYSGCVWYKGVRVACTKQKTPLLLVSSTKQYHGLPSRFANFPVQVMILKPLSILPQDPLSILSAVFDSCREDVPVGCDTHTMEKKERDLPIENGEEVPQPSGGNLISYKAHHDQDIFNKAPRVVGARKAAREEREISMQDADLLEEQREREIINLIKKSVALLGDVSPKEAWGALVVELKHRFPALDERDYYWIGQSWAKLRGRLRQGKKKTIRRIRG